MTHTALCEGATVAAPLTEGQDLHTLCEKVRPDTVKHMLNYENTRSL